MKNGLMTALAVLVAGQVAADLPEVRFEQFASGFDCPLHMLPYGSGAKAFLVVDQSGVIYHLDEKGGKPGSVFLDLRSRMVELKERYDERGALGLALHPGFKENGRFFVYYSATLQKGGAKDYDHTSHLSEFRMLPGGEDVDLGSEKVLLKIDQPQWNHNGGYIAFGPDGHLYVALGDGGAGNDLGPGHEEGGNGQAMGRLLGKVLRLDVSSGEGYTIPKDNPFVGREGRDEIYAVGFRNPWGMSFDKDGSLFLADVGQNRYEEINIVTKGANYGWPRYEAFVPFTAEKAADVPKDAKPPMPGELAAPILAYPHNKSYGEAPGYGISITGGHVYRGKALPGLQGVYLFADYPMSWGSERYGLFGAVKKASGGWSMAVLPGQKTPGGKDLRVVGFGQDQAGEAYVLTNAGPAPAKKAGAIWKIVPRK